MKLQTLQILQIFIECNITVGCAIGAHMCACEGGVCRVMMYVYVYVVCVRVCPSNRVCVRVRVQCVCVCAC